MNRTPVAPTVSEQIIVFADLRGYDRHICSTRSPEQIFDFLSGFYSVAQRSLKDSGGRIIKFIGDAILVVFPASKPDHSIAALKKLKAETDLFLSQGGYGSRLCIKAHSGTVAMGLIGEGELERLDVFGAAVNRAACLPNEEWVLSSELQKKMSS